MVDVEGVGSRSWGGAHEPAGHPVSTGDDVTYLGGGKYLIRISDGTADWTWRGGDPSVQGSTTLSVPTPAAGTTSSESIVECYASMPLPSNARDALKHPDSPNASPFNPELTDIHTCQKDAPVNA